MSSSGVAGPSCRPDALVRVSDLRLLFATYPAHGSTGWCRIGGGRSVLALLRPRRSGGRAVIQRQRSAPQWLVGDRTALVVTQAGFVVGEEHLADQVAAAADPGLVEDALEVLLDGVGRDHQPLGDLGSGVALQHQPGDLLLALGQPIG